MFYWQTNFFSLIDYQCQFIVSKFLFVNYRKIHKRYCICFELWRNVQFTCKPFFYSITGVAFVTLGPSNTFARDIIQGTSDDTPLRLQGLSSWQLEFQPEIEHDINTTPSAKFWFGAICLISILQTRTLSENSPNYLNWLEMWIPIMYWPSWHTALKGRCFDLKG